jgi:hypothetical protein
VSRITLQPIPVLTGSDDRDGLLVLDDGALVAVLVRLDSAVHEEQRGGWFLEVGLGPCYGPVHPVFESLEEAQEWVAKRLEAVGA